MAPLIYLDTHVVLVSPRGTNGKPLFAPNSAKAR
jgi:hypothetical protein